jgi:hypothetical protein
VVRARGNRDTHAQELELPLLQNRRVCWAQLGRRKPRLPNVRLVPTHSFDATMQHKITGQPQRGLMQMALGDAEALTLSWENVQLDPLPGARFGYLRVISEKSKNARRNLPLTRRATEMLRVRESGGLLAICVSLSSQNRSPTLDRRRSPSAPPPPVESRPTRGIPAFIELLANAKPV